MSKQIVHCLRQGNLSLGHVFFCMRPPPSAVTQELPFVYVELCHELGVRQSPASPPPESPPASWYSLEPPWVSTARIRGC